jgi:hypothetical protein
MNRKDWRDLILCNFFVYTFVICVVLLVSGCGPTAQEARQQNEASSRAPILVIESTPKGKLWMIEIAQAQTTEKHYVYYFDNSTNTVSVNYVVRRGKTHINQTIVIDGDEYILTPK